MGCSVSDLRDSTMSLCGNNDDDVDYKSKLERKLYLARESPEPIFDLSECSLKHVPSGIYSICKVFRKDYLYLNNNRLTSLEGGGHMSDLYCLKVLNISNNKFSHLHNDLKYLVNLTELYIQDNDFKYLPETIHNLQCLRILDVSKNRLKELTPSLGKLKELRKLNITENPSLNRLCPELCVASNLNTLELDGEQFLFPPPDISTSTTSDIMKFLCDHLNVEYLSPSHSKNTSPVQSPSTPLNPFRKHSIFSWEEQEAAIIEQENKMHKASKQQRELFLSKVLEEQTALDAEIAKVQELKEVERQILIKTIHEQEKDIDILINNFIQSTNLNPEAIQQQLEYEDAELQRLLEITRQNYDDIKKNDILSAMDLMIEDNYAFQQSKKNYDEYLEDIKKGMLAQELECSEKLDKFLKAKDESRTILVLELLEDQDIQKAIVASLLERVDAKSWSLNQEIFLVTSNLARLSLIEQEKQKLHMNYNYNELLNQRVHLLGLLDDLLYQQNKRRTQLVETLKEMENETDATTDYWLKNYQKIIDSAPKTLREAGKNLDPQLANNLLQAGVIHCLPFLVKFLFSEESLLAITDEKLKATGVRLSSDRQNIIQAIQDYVAAKTKIINLESETEALPSAPPVEDKGSCSGVVDTNSAESVSSESECVICMDSKCEVVFVPCGHMCCCIVCSEKEMQNCPMCRQDVERKIKVLIP